MASAYLQRGADNSSSTKGTLSFWCKRSGLGTDQRIFNTNNVNDPYFQFYFIGSSHKIRFQIYSGGSNVANFITSRVFRDTSAWYHIVLKLDTTQATQADRVKLYINGVEETDFDTSVYPSQNDNIRLNEGSLRIGGTSTGSYFDGSMAHVHFSDGYAYDADTFGETDSTTGIWKPKTSPSVTYGTNGFFLDFASSSDMGNDVSGNNNDLTVNGTITQTIDTPSNVFATFNSIHKSGTATHDPNFSQGNTSVTFDNGDDSTLSTLGVSSGKYYAEFKVTSDSADPTVGVGNESSNLVTNPGSSNIGSATGEYGYFSSGNKRINGSSSTSYGSTFTTNDIIGVALDLDNGAIWFSKNGTWQNSATIAEIEAGTTTNAAATGLSGTFFFGCANSASGTTGDAFSVNFGNGYFGTTAVASAGTNSGIGTFEYDVPSGYKALCTKNINAQEYS